MSNLFKRAIVFSDIHLGLKSNSQLHNEDCLSFVKWAMELAKEQECDACFFLGDWHHNRASINLVTLDYSLRALEVMANVCPVFFITGNHDLFYRDKRDIQSAVWARHIPNIRIINDFYDEGGVTFIPWLVKDEHKKIAKINSKFVFGHFELPHFFMNSSIQMPDHGDIQTEHFSNAGHVFSGHFHKRQSHENVTYIGNCFPHNYGDAGDDERGCMILDWDGTTTFHTWPDQPRYRVYNLSHVLNSAETILKPHMHVKVKVDIDITYEESTFIKDTFLDMYHLREITLIPNKNEVEGMDVQPGSIEFLSVDAIVADQISQINSEHYDPVLLLDIYRHL